MPILRGEAASRVIRLRNESEASLQTRQVTVPTMTHIRSAEPLLVPARERLKRELGTELGLSHSVSRPLGIWWYVP